MTQDAKVAAAPPHTNGSAIEAKEDIFMMNKVS
jgi:hypothetical protein